MAKLRRTYDQKFVKTKLRRTYDDVMTNFWS